MHILQHVNIVEIFEIFEIGHYGIVMEYVYVCMEFLCFIAKHKNKILNCCSAAEGLIVQRSKSVETV